MKKKRDFWVGRNRLPSAGDEPAVESPSVESHDSSQAPLSSIDVLRQAELLGPESRRCCALQDQRTVITHRSSPAGLIGQRPGTHPPEAARCEKDPSACLSWHEFMARLRVSGIYDDPTCDAIERDYAAAGDGLALAKQLVRADLLTNYQFAALVHGHAETLLFGDYVLEELLGTGFAGYVFRAHHRRFGGKVGLKILSPALMEEPEFEARFRREFAVMCQFEHPNLVRALQLFQTQETLAMAMDLAEGTSLADRVWRRGTLEVAEAVEYLRQAADGLAYAHRVGIVHRDIKPANLLLDVQDHIRVLDFGLASCATPVSSARLTSAEAMLGTPHYMAPEQCLSPQTLAPTADVYALGCVLRYLLTATPPYMCETVGATLRAHQSDPILPLRHCRPDVPRSLDDVYARMIQKDPHDRWSSMEELRDALAAVRY